MPATGLPVRLSVMRIAGEGSTKEPAIASTSAGVSCSIAATSGNRLAVGSPPQESVEPINPAARISALCLRVELGSKARNFRCDFMRYLPARDETGLSLSFHLDVQLGHTGHGD